MTLRLAGPCLISCLLLTLAATPAAGQAAAGPAQRIPGETAWGERLNAGFFWGQIYGGLASQNDKTTWSKLRTEIMANTTNLAVADPRPSRSFMQSAAAPARRQATYLQFGGAVEFASIGFGNGEGYTVAAFLGGARVIFPRQERFLPYVQMMAGLERSFGESGFAFEPGGGVIVPVNEWLLTLGVTLRRASYDQVSDNTFGLNIGLTVPFGQRR